jgi:hypothetical protein
MAAPEQPNAVIDLRPCKAFAKKHYTAGDPWLESLLKEPDWVPREHGLQLIRMYVTVLLDRKARVTP